MESVIAYTDRLWKSLKRPPRARRRIPVEIRGRLAPWIATFTRFDDKSYVIAVAERSGLSLVFEASTLDAFKPAMLAALRTAFEDLGIPVTALPEETADVESAAFIRRRDPVIRYEIEWVAGICGTEFPYFPDDLRRVQLNLNELPRPRQTPCVPCHAAPLRFAEPLESPLVR